MLNRSDRRHQAVALSVHRLDDRRSRAARLYRLAHFSQAPRQGRLADKRLGPAVREDVVLGDDTVAVLKQVQKHLKCLWFDSYYLASAAQFMAVVVEETVLKGIDHGRSSAASQEYILAYGSFLLR